ncbi:alpha-N-acetylgalactosaminide alpha-2,6-sialyltransferase 1 isoform X1 [Equus quagga]|uniref:alpha-N-acetylgalactosaminide alpha-2,6-sialyltransferase 1 isoform X1 n=2 Tax=Equus quagga TaxID=89248 RepID=UPI001EE287A2|nr:alpha-N-acetylgalactosaminide alpha-2,6-sialyltransferase 1 isoform X1 [Equus quagga]XP_046530159.1 alpha-N-acetylgalactosaminide alpha-2,6-sialyltransferase 1 isoform X1 [Equus quagga]
MVGIAERVQDWRTWSGSTRVTSHSPWGKHTWPGASCGVWTRETQSPELFRHQYIQNIKERSPELLQKSVSQSPPMGSRTIVRVESAQEKSVADTRPTAKARTAADGGGTEAGRAAAEQRGSAPSTARTGAPKSWERKHIAVDTLSPRSQDGGVASDRTEALRLKSQNARTTKGMGDQMKKAEAAKTVPVKPQGKAAATAKIPIRESEARALTTTAAGSTRRRTKGATTALVPPKERARATPASAGSQSSTTQRSQSLKAANFKSEPRWDFEENYSLDVGGLQTTCSDSVKVKASKSLWLQNLFLPNLTLFLDSSRFNQSEWDRLEHFAPPFGFMELNHSLVQKVVTRFPPVPQQQLLLASLPPGSSQCITCAVVGNGGILNDSRMGQEIDSHDHVFRLSGAVIKGYEQDVGTRTSFYGFTAFSLTQSLLILGNRGFRHPPLGKDVRYLHFLEGTRDYEWLEALLLNETLVKQNLFWFRRRPQEAFQEALQLDRYLLLHPDLLRYMKNRFLRSKTLDSVHWRIYRPTTGALLLLTALQLCDQVSAYGFITEGHERFSDHYYDKSWKRTIFYINHDFKLERTLWKRLHDEGIIRLYQRPVTSKPQL